MARNSRIPQTHSTSDEKGELMEKLEAMGFPKALLMFPHGTTRTGFISFTVRGPCDLWHRLRPVMAARVLA